MLMYQRKYVLSKIRKRAILAVMLLGVTGTVFAAISSLSGSLEDQATKLQGEYNQLMQKTEEGRTKTKIVREARPIYEKLHLTNGKESIDPNIASAQLEVLRKSYAFEIPQASDENSRARIDPVRESIETSLKRPQAVVVSADITIPQMFLYTDESMERLLKQMRSAFGGVIQMTRFTMTLKRAELGDKVKKEEPAVAVSIDAKWFGLKLLEKNSSTPPSGGKK